METTVLLAHAFGLTYLVVGLGMVISPTYYEKNFKKMMECPGFLYLAGLVTLLAGFFILSVHCIWEISLAGLITLIGALTFLKGIFLIVFPEWQIKIAASLIKSSKQVQTVGVIIAVLGAVVGYLGCVA